MPDQDNEKMVLVRGPIYRDKLGNPRAAFPDRLIPRSQATSAHIKALGIEIVENIDSGLIADPLKSSDQIANDKLQKENEELRKRLAELQNSKKPAAEKPKATQDAGN